MTSEERDVLVARALDRLARLREREADEAQRETERAALTERAAEMRRVRR